MVNFENLPNTTTPLNKINLEKMQEFSYRGNAPTDLNDARQFGIYHLSTSTTTTNLPVTGDIYGILIVYQNKGGTWIPSESAGGNSWIWQEIRTTTGEIFTRYATNLSTSWSQWKEMSDSGWNALTPISPFTTNVLVPLRYRKLNNVVYVFGFIYYNNTTPTFGTTIAQLPQGFRPLQEHDFCGRTIDRNAVTTIAVRVNGDINFLYDVGDESHTATGCVISCNFIADN